MKRTAFALFGTLGLVALGSAACGSDSAAEVKPSTSRVCTDVQPTFASLSEKIFTYEVKDASGKIKESTCGGSGCHSTLPTTGPQATLKMFNVSAAELHAALLKETDRLDKSVRVVPGNPAQSFLVAKIKGDYTGFPCVGVPDPSKAGHCGEKMPSKPNPALCANEIAAIEKWIADGALP